MSKGEVSVVKVAARFGYGAKGLPPVVPPNVDLEYEVELLDFEVEKELESLTVTERKITGIQKRERGNWWYGREEASLAIQCYRRALEFLDDVEGGIVFPDDEKDKTAVTEELRQLMEERLKTYNNMAAAQLKLKAYDAALTSVEAVLKCQPNNSKALYRKGKILTSKEDTDGALEAFKRVSELEPNTKSILQEINQLQAKRKKEREGEKMLYKRMFKGPGSSSEDSQEGKNASTKRSFSIGMVIGGVVIALAGAMAYRYRFV
jgi:FK506-binding protein 8